MTLICVFDDGSGRASCEGRVEERVEGVAVPVDLQTTPLPHLPREVRRLSAWEGSMQSVLQAGWQGRPPDICGDRRHSGHR